MIKSLILLFYYFNYRYFEYNKKIVTEKGYLKKYDEI